MILQIIERGENGSPVNGIRNCSVGSKVLLLDTNIGMNPPKLSNLRGSHFLKSLTNHHAVVSSPFLSESACCAFCFCGVGLRLLMLVPPIVVRFISVFSELLINFCSSCQWLMPFFVFAPLARQRSFVIALDMRKKTTRVLFLPSREQVRSVFDQHHYVASFWEARGSEAEGNSRIVTSLFTAASAMTMKKNVAVPHSLMNSHA